MITTQAQGAPIPSLGSGAGPANHAHRTGARRRTGPTATLTPAWRWLPALALAATLLPAGAASVFVEAESFAQRGGWTLDTQFIHVMGSPYLLAHGLGRPVANAETTVHFPAAGRYAVWARTKEWVSPWKAPGTPGRFQIRVRNSTLPHVFGANTNHVDWTWEAGGTVTIDAPGPQAVALLDLTGFDGRCDALFFSSDPGARPPSTRAERRAQLALPARSPETDLYDLVVCGGGYSGMGAALSAARQGLRVALIQDRPVLGGNGSSEIQVWAKGGTRRGLFPRLGEIVEEFADQASNSPGAPEEFGDAKKEAIIRAEPNIALFLNSYVLEAELEPGRPDQIRSVLVLDTRTGAEQRFRGRFFVDATGHGSVGALAGARYSLLEEGHLGMSNMWKWEERPEPADWPATPWALPLELGDFPATKKADGSLAFHKGEWFWESGFAKHPLHDLELIRDWNLRAVFGAFSAMKHGPERSQYARAQLLWVAAIGGNRESRLLTGDVVLTREDIEKQRPFPDGCVPTTWDIDLHYPKEQYAKKFPDNPFISRAEFGSGVDKRDGYPIPYRCFYSTNVQNLFMAGRCISVTHGALGTVRVMRTCGMMGEVVGKAAFLTVRHHTTPRGVYEQYLDELKELLRQPGAARRDAPDGPLRVPSNAPQLPPRDFLDAAELEGLVIDDLKAVVRGKWESGQGLKPYLERGYRYAAAGSDASARFEFLVPASGRYEVRVAWQPHPNRASNVACTIESAAGLRFVRLNQKEKPAPDGIFHSLGLFDFDAGTPGAVIVSAKDANGFVHIDGIQVRPAP